MFSKAMKKLINLTLKEREKIEVTASVVLYNENLEELRKTVNCFLSVPLEKRLFLIDNTADKKFQNTFKQVDIVYIAVGKNIGFGSGHNIILNRIKGFSKFHLVLNPDVLFHSNTLLSLIRTLEGLKEAAMIAPKVRFPNGAHQFTCRRYPLVTELLARRFPFFKILFKATVLNGVYSDRNLTKPFFVEYITGCFQLYKTEDFVQLRGFDERYFLYMEDVDICKKMDVLGMKKIYYPQEEIVHVLKQGSSKSIKLLIRHISSIIKYFLKWGF
jgi:GT2 family glycosyltransferase